MTLAAGLRLARAMLTRGAIVTATVTAVAVTVGACAAQAGSPTPVPVTEPADAPLEAVDLPDARTVPGVGAGAGAELSDLLDQGEAAYRARRGDEALAAFQRVVALDPGHAQAWLRLGNLHQQRHDWFKALAAYRRVAARSSGDGVDPSLRAKALYNLAIINLELAQQSLRTLERIGPAATVAGPREPLSSAVTAAQRRLTVFASPAESPVRAAPAPAPAPPAPSRASKARDRADSDAPRIDYIRGAPRPWGCGTGCPYRRRGDDVGAARTWGLLITVSWALARALHHELMCRVYGGSMSKSPGSPEIDAIGDRVVGRIRQQQQMVAVPPNPVLHGTWADMSSMRLLLDFLPVVLGEP